VRQVDYTQTEGGCQKIAARDARFDEKSWRFALYRLSSPEYHLTSVEPQGVNQGAEAAP